ncbi:MAG: hypothetical protein V1663_00055 [archaeon]
MNKKGMKEHQILWIAYIIFAAFILLLLIGNIKDMYSGKKITKEFLARDFGMVVESSYVANGNLDLEYNLGEEYYVNIENGVFSVREGLQSSSGSYLIAEDGVMLKVNGNRCNKLEIFKKLSNNFMIGCS